MCAQWLSHIWLCNPKDCSPPGSSVQGILQAFCKGFCSGDSGRLLPGSFSLPAFFFFFFLPSLGLVSQLLLVQLPLLSLAPGSTLSVFLAGIPQTARILSIWFQTTFSTSSVSILCLHQPSYRIQDSLNLHKHASHIWAGAPSSSCSVVPSCPTLMTPWTGVSCHFLVQVFKVIQQI